MPAFDRWTIGTTRLTPIVEAETPHIPVQLFYPEAVGADVEAALESVRSRPEQRLHPEGYVSLCLATGDRSMKHLPSCLPTLRRLKGRFLCDDPHSFPSLSC